MPLVLLISSGTNKGGGVNTQEQKSGPFVGLGCQLG